jgi:hypothetical protein
MFTEIALPDPIDTINIDLHKSMSMSFVSPIAPVTSQSLHHPLGSAPRNPQSLCPDDSAHSIFLEGLPHVRAKLDAR